MQAGASEQTPRVPPDRRDRQWHATSTADAFSALDSRASGLAESEALARLTRDGPNRLALSSPVSALRILLTQFRSVVVALLVGAMCLSLALGDRIETIAIAIVIAVNTAIGFVIELRGRRAMEALRHLVARRATVVRDGRPLVVDAEGIVPGDVVDLSSGLTVPADGRVINSVELSTDEAILTGESLPVDKQSDVPLDGPTPLAERTNMVYQGTTVVAGTGRMLVTSTADRTEVGRIGALTRAMPEERTPLERRLDELGRRLVWVSLGAGAAIGVLGIAQGESWLLMMQTGIALAVAAVPEALPTVATIALAVGLARMARRRALVRRLPAVESLGATTIVCTDKTRTLTSGNMTVARVWTPSGEYKVSAAAPADEVLHRALRIAARASRPQPPGETSQTSTTADPVDAAIARALHAIRPSASVSDRPPKTVIPFSSARMFMAVVHDEDGQSVASVKGAPHRIVEMSSWVDVEGVRQVIDEAWRDRLQRENATLAADGLRVLGVAAGSVADGAESALVDLTFVGFIGLIDPPAEGVKDAIGRLRRAGLRTVMLTGDQRLTAEAIGRDLGVLGPNDEAIDSRELEALAPEALDARLARIGVFSRVTPEDKLRVVRAFQTRGDIVAMLGDGVNDAPALRKADVGVAMGQRGTDVAREAAAIVLQDDQFGTVAAAVEEGRVIFDNILKFVFYLFSCNLAEVVVLLVAALLRLPLPLLPLQILWLNIVTDTFPALALAVEPRDLDVMSRPPRDPRASTLSWPFFLDVLGYAALITASTLAAYTWALGRPSTSPTTVAFMTLALAQTFHLGNARSQRPVLSRAAAFANPFAIGAVVVSVALQVVAVSVPLIATALGVRPLSFAEWVVVSGAASIPAIVGQAIHLLRSPRAAH